MKRWCRARRHRVIHRRHGQKLFGILSLCLCEWKLMPPRNKWLKFGSANIDLVSVSAVGKFKGDSSKLSCWWHFDLMSSCLVLFGKLMEWGLWHLGPLSKITLSESWMGSFWCMGNHINLAVPRLSPRWTHFCKLTLPLSGAQLRNLFLAATCFWRTWEHCRSSN